MRDNRWKLVLGESPKLYDLTVDAAEKHNVASIHPAIVKHLQTAAAAATVELGSDHQTGRNVRSGGRAKQPTARIHKKGTE